MKSLSEILEEFTAIIDILVEVGKVEEDYDLMERIEMVEQELYNHVLLEE